jgi:pentatricopeptide repeat protein
MYVSPACVQGAGTLWTYNMAIIACGRGACAAEAVAVMDRMLDAGLLPCLTTYTALMSLFCRAGDLASARRIFHAMHASGVEPNTITYSSLINGCDKANDLAAACHYFDEMLVRTIPFTHGLCSGALPSNRYV